MSLLKVVAFFKKIHSTQMAIFYVSTDKYHITDFQAVCHFNAQFYPFYSCFFLFFFWGGWGVGGGGVS